MTVEILAIERNINANKMTLVRVKKDGIIHRFTAGRDVGERRIYELAKTLKLEEFEI